MKLTTQQLKRMIVEEINEIKGIDEPASGGELGKWVFPNQNMYSDKAQDADEENTQAEATLLKYLKAIIFFADSLSTEELYSINIGSLM